MGSARLLRAPYRGPNQPRNRPRMVVATVVSAASHTKGLSQNEVAAPTFGRRRRPPYHPTRPRRRRRRPLPYPLRRPYRPRRRSPRYPRVVPYRRRCHYTPSSPLAGPNAVGRPVLVLGQKSDQVVKVGRYTHTIGGIESDLAAAPPPPRRRQIDPGGWQQNPSTPPRRPFVSVEQDWPGSSPPSLARGGDGDSEGG